jgi:hypothetical protein
MTETAYKAVDANLTSAFIPWHNNPAGPVRYTYEVGASYDAAGIQAILGYWYRVFDESTDPPTLEYVVITPPPDPPVSIRDPVNRYRGITAFPSLDSFGLRPFGKDPVPGARYLQLEYELDDVLGVGNASTAGRFPPEALSLAAVHVVAEVFP